MIATKDFLETLEQTCADRREAIGRRADALKIRGTTYYVSAEGDDACDGLTPDTAWRSLARVSDAALRAGDGILFRRGDIFRGFLRTSSGVSYGAYGEGEKPRLYGWDRNLADETLWEIYDEAHHIWHLKTPILDCGTLVFNGGEAHCRKLIPSYVGGRFVCRDDESRLFDMAREMTEDLDLFCFYDARLDTRPSRGEDFPVPLMDDQSLGDLYLRCDKGNPAVVYCDIEALPGRTMVQVGDCADVTLDNLCVRYVGCHGVGAGGFVKGLHVTGCEFEWIGGVIQHYMGTDPNYPEGGRGTVTRYGNAVEIYGGCEDYLVADCYINQVYDAGITHQITTCGRFVTMTNICYRDNLIERCVYGIEYFLEKTDGDTESYIKNCEMRGNIIRFSGHGWGQQRHNYHTPAHIKGWSYENTASDFVVCDNVFDRAAYRMLHLVARERESCPVLRGNVYIQTTGMTLGQYGANKTEEPPICPYDENAETVIREAWGDRDARVYFTE